MLLQRQETGMPFESKKREVANIVTAPSDSSLKIQPRAFILPTWRQMKLKVENKLKGHQSCSTASICSRP
jgi:hypothetical protein